MIEPSVSRAAKVMLDQKARRALKKEVFVFRVLGPCERAGGLCLVFGTTFLCVVPNTSLRCPTSAEIVPKDPV